MSKTLQLRQLASIRVSNVDKRTVPNETAVRLCNYVDVFGSRVLSNCAPYMRATASPAEIEKFRLRHCDLAITKDSETPAEIGVPALIEAPGDDLVLGYHLALIRPHPDKTDPYFLLVALQSAAVRRHYRRSATGVTRFGLSIDAIHTTPIPDVPLTAQRRIGRWYRAACQDMAATAEMLRAHHTRRACLHRELVQGTLRFPAHGNSGSGVSPPEGWTVRRLGDVAEVRVSNTDKKTRPEEEPVRLCNYLDVWRNDYIDDTMPFMPATATATQVATLSLCKDDVLLTKDSETREDIASTAVVRSVPHGVVLGYHLALVRPDSRAAIGGFIAKQLMAPLFRRHFIRAATGATRYGLALKTIRDATVWLPSLAEQQDVFRALENCDLEIEIMERRLKVLDIQRRQIIEDVCKTCHGIAPNCGN